MEKRIAVSKVARLLGVKRADLSKRLLAAGIPTFEGEVDFEQVQCIAPTIGLVDGDIFERVQVVRENMMKSKGGASADHDAADLAGQVEKLSNALVIEAQMSRRYRQIIVDFAEKLGDLQLSGQPEQRDMAFKLCEWLRAEIIED